MKSITFSEFSMPAKTTTRPPPNRVPRNWQPPNLLTKKRSPYPDIGRTDILLTNSSSSPSSVENEANERTLPPGPRPP